jgi:DNA helicase-2/ATP-dependent DNA helicase PcrA
MRIINTPARGIGKTTVERLLACAEQTGRTPLEVLSRPEDIHSLPARSARNLASFAELLARITTMADTGGVQQVLEFALLHSGLRAMWHQANDTNALENANELVNAAADYDHQRADGSGSLVDWLQRVSLVGDTDALNSELGAVTLMTLHAAKGLEFDTVFIAGVEDGLLPHQRRDQESADVEEERRLFFVGMTRARRALTLTAAAWRDVRGAGRRSSRSIFLHELPGDEVQWMTVGDQDRRSYDHDQPMTASAVDYLEWRRGQLVRHPRYGLGRVMWIRPGSRLTRAGVTFTAYGDKTIILEHSDLELVDVNEPDYDS